MGFNSVESYCHEERRVGTSVGKCNWFIKYHYLRAVRQMRMHYYERKRVQSSRGMFRDKITLRPSLINWRCSQRRWFVDTKINFFSTLLCVIQRST